MSEKLTDIFAIDVFNETRMAERLPKKTYAALKKTIENGDDLDPSVAEIVANAMKDWAIERGATHYSHWFQPMTGITAEKHDSFISPTNDGKVIMEFSGKELVKGEPDASSFPSGGLRATFEARGYTAWDCTSPAFLREDAAGVTLCIPTAFCSYTGEALDMKTPLLRSMEAISAQAVRILKLFGHEDVKRVTTSVGPEQEYFLVDKDKYMKRQDLIFAGRTLFGTMPPKGQEMEDHYYGSIKEKIATFMRELNVELWKMGVTAKTQHNEAAPAQHELAPIYATANIASDHNQLIMECMKRVASHHGLACLLHEKPFEGVNGSGKHNNWSMVTNTGKNVLDPGKTPHENVQFLLFLSAVLQAVDEHADLLRISAANPGNDHRLGADEAPPAIISVFIGSQLEDVLSQLIETGEAKSCKEGGKLNIGVHTLPELKKDATDRNRTSPFAFTGNKFEFRMVASSMSIAMANTVLNTIVADVLDRMADELEQAEDFDLAIHDLIKKSLTDHNRIVFNGNGYAEAWVKEAERRGLPNIKNMVDAIPALTTKKAIDLFGKHHIFTPVELHSRAEVLYESYSKTINIEAKTMISMAGVQFIPAVINYIKKLADSINAVKAAAPDIDVSVQTELLKETSKLLSKAEAARKKLEAVVKEASSMGEGADQAAFFRDKVVPAMEELRAPIDALEQIVDKELWPVPTYGDLLFEV
ncbi:MAG: glutamine synthetase type III [Lachnospiraceae bacterium]|jgi:glutamine synthetase|nr:glutamine synthetase type III [Lachnospiraceae bacterium]